MIFSDAKKYPRVNTTPKHSANSRQNPVFRRIPSMSFLPQNCAVKIPAPEQMPKRMIL